MAYQTYTTEAVVCGSYDSYTSDRSYLLFSREAGMVWASAKSVREERSKQRSALQDFSIVRVSLVKGKSGWRIGSAQALGNPFLGATTRAQRGLVAYAIKQLRRFVHGESALPEVYTDLHYVLTHADALSQHEQVKTLFILRLLATLGYVPNHAEYAQLIDAKSLADALQQYTPKQFSRIDRVVEEAVRASHL